MEPWLGVSQRRHAGLKPGAYIGAASIDALNYGTQNDEIMFRESVSLKCVPGP
jgi:hypothetical protein